jgi:hypothetical protein
MQGLFATDRDVKLDFTCTAGNVRQEGNVQLTKLIHAGRFAWRQYSAVHRVLLLENFNAPGHTRSGFCQSPYRLAISPGRPAGSGGGRGCLSGVTVRYRGIRWAFDTVSDTLIRAPAAISPPPSMTDCRHVNHQQTSLPGGQVFANELLSGSCVSTVDRWKSLVAPVESTAP